MATLNIVMLLVAGLAIIAIHGGGFATAHNAGKFKPGKEQLQVIRERLERMYQTIPDLVPAGLRLAFHDCVGLVCDGCINPEHHDNRGLRPMVETVERVRSDPAVDPYMSTADMWALTGIVAVEQGIKLSNDYCNSGEAGSACKIMPPLTTPFKWGRPDCHSSPYAEDDFSFPVGTMSRNQAMSYFKQNYGFTENEATAFMGSHTLGRARTTNSGYLGSRKVGEENHFNTGYYEMMRNNKLTFDYVAIDPEDANGDGDRKVQMHLTDCNGTLVGSRLKTDMTLVYDLEYTDENGVKCEVGNRIGKSGPVCPDTPTAKQVDKYIRDPGSFIRDFSAALERVLDHGNPDLIKI